LHPNSEMNRRNSSAVEHFTRNEGVPSSNLGFGSENQQVTEM
jgi:hypothetical protein